MLVDLQHIPNGFRLGDTSLFFDAMKIDIRHGPFHFVSAHRWIEIDTGNIIFPSTPTAAVRKPFHTQDFNKLCRVDQKHLGQHGHYVFVGSKVGLVDALASYSEAKTSLEIAEDTGLKER